jgi:hypothetical protein
VGEGAPRDVAGAWWIEVLKATGRGTHLAWAAWRAHRSRRPILAERMRQGWGFPFLGVDAALPDGVGHAVDRQHVCSDAIVHAVRFGVAYDVVER